MKRYENFVVFGTHDQNTLEQMSQVASGAVRSALMADGHYGYLMPVGGVAALDNWIDPLYVGFDISCGNCAIKTDVKLVDLGKSPDKLDFMLGRIADAIQSTISFGVGGSGSSMLSDHPLFDSDCWYRLKGRVGHGEARKLRDKAQLQLTSVGSGNHYCDVFVDETGWIWVGVHFGSRGFGHGIASGFINLAHGKDWHDRVVELPSRLELMSSLGQDYWAMMELCGEYAYAGREWVTRKIISLISTDAKEVEMIHNHHNFAWKEKHLVPVGIGCDINFPLENLEHREVVVVRKGATPAFPGQKGFVGGSMGDVSVILEGAHTIPEYGPGTDYADLGEAVGYGWKFKVEDSQINALYSTVHGAGRVMSRTEAAGKRDRKTGALKLNEDGSPKKAPRVTEEMMKEWITRQNVIVRGGGVDESPHVYRRLPEVLKSQGDTIKVLHELTPLIVCMAGKDIRDPYSD